MKRCLLGLICLLIISKVAQGQELIVLASQGEVYKNNKQKVKRFDKLSTSDYLYVGQGGYLHLLASNGKDTILAKKAFHNGYQLLNGLSQQKNQYANWTKFAAELQSLQDSIFPPCSGDGTELQYWIQRCPAPAFILKTGMKKIHDGNHNAEFAILSYLSDTVKYGTKFCISQDRYMADGVSYTLTILDMTNQAVKVMSMTPKEIFKPLEIDLSLLPSKYERSFILKIRVCLDNNTYASSCSEDAVFFQKVTWENLKKEHSEFYNQHKYLSPLAQAFFFESIELYSDAGQAYERMIKDHPDIKDYKLYLEEYIRKYGFDDKPCNCFVR